MAQTFADTTVIHSCGFAEPSPRGRGLEIFLSRWEKKASRPRAALSDFATSATMRQLEARLAEMAEEMRKPFRLYSLVEYGGAAYGIS